MHPLPSLFLLWAQTKMPGVPDSLVKTLKWLYIFGEPGITDSSIPLLGGLIAWLKVVGLFALMGWVFSWVLAANRTRSRSRVDWLDIAALAALVGCLSSVVLNVLETTGRIRPLSARGVAAGTILALACGAVILLWTERAVWTSIRRFGRVSDALVLAGIHLAVALGIGVAYVLIGSQVAASQGMDRLARPPLVQVAVDGVRLGASYMGLVVLIKVFWLLVPELLALRPRRLYAIARLGVAEATRKMWAPWVVIFLFVVILAFTHWFLPAPQQRPAELGRIFVGTLSLLCMLLLTVMVTVLSPLSLPQDIQAQTIYTVVTKPTRRLELIWGRMIGYMAIVTALVLLFGAASLGYLYREIKVGAIDRIVDQAEKLKPTDPDRAKYLDEQADQLRARMSARVPVKGSLTFLDSLGKPQIKGVDVGQELEFRSHIEGGTPASAIWTFGSRIPDPFDPRRALNRRIPVEDLLGTGTIEAIEDQALRLEYNVAGIGRRQQEGKLPAADAARATAEASAIRAQIQGLRDQSQKLRADFDRKILDARTAERDKKVEDADRLRKEAAALHSPPIPLEMTFTIYRTTKGRVGEPVYAEIEVESPVPTMPRFRDTFPVREYYTNKRFLPSSFLVGSLGELKITVHCMSPTQYLGMSESDLYLLADSGNFGENFMKGLFGIWLQAMVLTAIGVFAGTFLSWPVALLFTIAFFVAGHAAFSILQQFFLQSIVGGGPFESMFRLLSHENLVNELAPTLGVVAVKTLDSLVMPVMRMMIYLIPNLAALDVSNTVAEGYAVGWPLIFQNTLVALAYTIPFSIAGYFILKNREVAA